LFCGALLGESSLFSRIGRSLRGESGRAEETRRPGLPPRLGETMLSTRLDSFLMAVFLVSHLLFFRNFFLNPGLALEVLGGNLELKHSFKTIPGVTTWTQISLVVGAIRGM